MKTQQEHKTETARKYKKIRKRPRKVQTNSSNNKNIKSLLKIQKACSHL